MFGIEPADRRLRAYACLARLVNGSFPFRLFHCSSCSRPSSCFMFYPCSASRSSSELISGRYQSFSLFNKSAIYLLSCRRAKRNKQNAAAIRMSEDNEYIEFPCSMWTRNGLTPMTRNSLRLSVDRSLRQSVQYVAMHLSLYTRRRSPPPSSISWEPDDLRERGSVRNQILYGQQLHYDRASSIDNYSARRSSK